MTVEDEGVKLLFSNVHNLKYNITLSSISAANTKTTIQKGLICGGFGDGITPATKFLTGTIRVTNEAGADFELTCSSGGRC